MKSTENPEAFAQRCIDYYLKNGNLPPKGDAGLFKRRCNPDSIAPNGGAVFSPIIRKMAEEQIPEWIEKEFNSTRRPMLDVVKEHVEYYKARKIEVEANKIEAEKQIEADKALAKAENRKYVPRGSQIQSEQDKGYLWKNKFYKKLRNLCNPKHKYYDEDIRKFCLTEIKDWIDALDSDLKAIEDGTKMTTMDRIKAIVKKTKANGGVLPQYESGFLVRSIRKPKDGEKRIRKNFNQEAYDYCVKHIPVIVKDVNITAEEKRDEFVHEMVALIKSGSKLPQGKAPALNRILDKSTQGKRNSMFNQKSYDYCMEQIPNYLAELEIKIRNKKN